MNFDWVKGLAASEARTFSQLGEDGVIAAIFDAIGKTNRICVDIGAGASEQGSNTALLRRQGWACLPFEAGPSRVPGVRCVKVTAENVTQVLARRGTPKRFDFLSLDIDGNDLWVLRALTKTYRPRVICIEYNPLLEGCVVHPYHPDFRWRKDPNYGMSFEAGVMLAEACGYSVVHSNNLNLFMVDDDVLGGHQVFDVPHALTRYHPGDVDYTKFLTLTPDLLL